MYRSTVCSILSVRSLNEKEARRRPSGGERERRALELPSSRKRKESFDGMKGSFELQLKKMGKEQLQSSGEQRNSIRQSPLELLPSARNRSFINQVLIDT